MSGKGEVQGFVVVSFTSLAAHISLCAGERQSSIISLTSGPDVELLGMV